MTLEEFKEMIREFPESIDIVRYRGLNDVLPRIVWGEARIEQSYASNLACEEKMVIALEYMTRAEDDANVKGIKDVFRAHQIPFVCEVGYDVEGDYISYMFNIYLEEEA